MDKAKKVFQYNLVESFFPGKVVQIVALTIKSDALDKWLQLPRLYGSWICEKSPPDCHMSTIFKIYQNLLRIAALTNLIFIIEINNYQVAQRLH